MKTPEQKQFLKKLADLCERYNATFSYTIDDDGIHIAVDGVADDLFMDDAPQLLREAINEPNHV